MDAALPPLIATAFDLRLVSREQIVRLADKAIIESPKPPDWLLELSCASAEISPYDLGRLLPRVREATDEELLALLAYGWKRRLLDPQKIGRLLFDRFCLSSWTEMTPLRQAIYIYDDELGWNASRAEDTLWGILKPHVAVGEELMAPMKNA